MDNIIPCIWLDDNAEQAADFYIRLFPYSRIITASRYPQKIDNPGNKPRGSILTIEIEIQGRHFSLLNGGPYFSLNPSISFFVQVETPDVAVRLFEGLATDGEVLMPIDRYPWSERYGWVKDQFGVTWQIITGRRATGTDVIAPCLMFQKQSKGKTMEAMQFYSNCFSNSRIDHIEHYSEGEGPVGYVKHGRYTLGGQTMFAMDSPIDHDFYFNEAISLQVMCKDQNELDNFWNILADGGEHSQCGWLKDRFGISWQIVPAAMLRWMKNDDGEAWDNAFQSMMVMQKLDIATLEKHFQTGQS